MQCLVCLMILYCASRLPFPASPYWAGLKVPSSFSMLMVCTIYYFKHLVFRFYEHFSAHPEAQRTDGLMIVRIEQALHFANTGLLKDSLRRYSWFILSNLHPNPNLKSHLLLRYHVFVYRYASEPYIHNQCFRLCSVNAILFLVTMKFN